MHPKATTPSPSTSYIPIGDTEERQYSNVPANESQASMIPLMRIGSKLRLSAAIDVYEADKDRINPTMRQKLHLRSDNELHANWRLEGTPIFHRSCQLISGQHDSTHDKEYSKLSDHHLLKIIEAKLTATNYAHRSYTQLIN
ncbi:hypothetical protein J6590_082130 [Homalodisca vitripennis]|nr:hypothetical protein J6590_082130 [Homalodisca vitripennis]